MTRLCRFRGIVLRGAEAVRRWVAARAAVRAVVARVAARAAARAAAARVGRLPAAVAGATPGDVGEVTLHI